MQEIVDKLNLIYPTIDLTPELGKYNFSKNVIEAVLTEPYYVVLAAYIKAFNINKVLELGTCSGASAVAMAKYAKEVHTYDIVDSLEDKNINTGNIIFNIIKPEECLDINFQNYDFIFVDIAHDGYYETKLHQKFCEVYNKIVFYDDVLLNYPMAKFWDSIEQKKIWTLHHYSGLGMVSY